MDKIFAYCERGLNPGFWAEPLNAISNAAFTSPMISSGRRYDPSGCRMRMIGPISMRQRARPIR